MTAETLLEAVETLRLLLDGGVVALPESADAPDKPLASAKHVCTPQCHDHTHVFEVAVPPHLHEHVAVLPALFTGAIELVTWLVWDMLAVDEQDKVLLLLVKISGDAGDPPQPLTLTPESEVATVIIPDPNAVPTTFQGVSGTQAVPDTPQALDRATAKSSAPWEPVGPTGLGGC